VLQQLLTSRSTVLNDQLILRNNLDQFKLQLGVPTDVPLELDDSLIRPIDRHLARLRRVFAEDSAVQAEEVRLLRLDPAAVRAELRRLLTELPIVQGTRFREDVLARLAEWEALTPDQIKTRRDRLVDELGRLVAERNRLERARQPIPDELNARIAELDYPIDLADLEEGLRFYETRPWLPPPGGAVGLERQEAMRIDIFRRAFRAFVQVVGVARDERLEKIRADWPKLPAVCLNGVDLLAVSFDEATTAAQQYALANRLDLMNARAQLVDAWRQIAVRANSLLGVLDVTYHLDSTTPPGGSNPFAFSADRTRQRLTINGELPLVRRLERNAYRTELIAYQRQRRRLQAAEDQVLLEVRNQLRQLRVQAENYKIQQRAIQVAYSQRDNSIETLRAPNPPGQGANAGSAAALTQQLLNAQNRVPQTENSVFSVYVNYLIARLQLFRDLELMPLDPRGVWTDDHTSDCAGPCVPPAGADGPRGREPERLPEPQPGPQVGGDPPR
jgi:hypothetical protein